jgi:SPP1 family predicted phage head-tail adaptor
MIRAGELRHQVGIQTSTSTPNIVGQPVQTWTDAAVVWASIKPTSGAIKSQQTVDATTPTETHQVSMRWNPTVNTRCRLRYGTGDVARYFTINEVRDVEERREMIFITATEITA